MSTSSHGHDDHGHGHGSPFIAHHFDDAKHQFESGKLGIWLFLAQEILFFSALFVAYIIYRHNHPEIFAYAHHYLDVKWGAINTAVLIVSSLSAAWAVRAAQLGQKRLLIGCLAITLVCAFGFLGIKTIEYSHKAHIGTIFGKRFQPTVAADGSKIDVSETPSDPTEPGQAPDSSKMSAQDPGQATEARMVDDTPDPQAGEGAGAAAAVADEEVADPQAAGAVAAAAAATDAANIAATAEAAKLPPPNTGMFFTIYFAMTGLHGIHVLAGVFVFIWLLVRAVKGHFTPEYYGPVDFAALYWHLVDLIWIFLFPLLYLIH